MRFRCGSRSAPPYQATSGRCWRPSGRPSILRIGDRDRLHGGGAAVGDRPLRRADERGAERQHLVAVARRAFREEHHDVALREPPGDLVACAPVACRLLRSTKTVRCVRARKPTTGQPATSCLATKETGATLARTGMSSQELWLERRSSGRSSAGLPVTVTRMPIRRQTKRCQSCATFMVERPPILTATSVERQQHRERERGEERRCRRSGSGRASGAPLSAVLLRGTT